MYVDHEDDDSDYIDEKDNNAIMGRGNEQNVMLYEHK